MHATTLRRWPAIVAMVGIVLFASDAFCDSAATATVNQTVTISVSVAAGTQPFDYQWRKDGVNIADRESTSSIPSSISGTTTAACVITNAQVSDGGSYTVVVTCHADPTLSTISDKANLTVNAAAVIPPNDSFSTSTSLGNALQAQLSASNTNATKEANEPNHAGNAGGASVWWRWTAPANGILALDTADSSFNTLLAVYRGTSVDALAAVAYNDDSGGKTTSALTCAVAAGTTYYIAVDGKNGATGSITLNLALTGAPTNDDFVNSTLVSGSSVTVTGASNVAASKQATEPSHAGNAGGASVWWYWTAPESGSVSVNTLGSAFDTLLAVYTGSSLSALTAVASDDDSGGSGTSALTFTAVSGTTYSIAVDGKGGATGSIVLKVVGQYGGSSSSGSSGSPGSSGGGGGTGVAASFVYPAGVARDASGNLYVADTGANTILKVNSSGVVDVLAGATGLAGMQDGTGDAARFSHPVGVAADTSGNIFVADTGNAAIRKISPAGVVTTLAGSTANRGNHDGTGTAAWFNSPAGVAADTTGNVYVADSYANTIRKVTSSGAVTTLAGSANAHGDADGVGTSAQFNNPVSVAVDGSGNVFVADSFNATIRKVTSSGVVTTLAGSSGILGANDGTTGGALFNLPVGLAIDTSSNLYVADAGNALIRRVSSAGVVVTVAGMAETAGYLNAAGTNALFNQPGGLAVDVSGTVYVADSGNGVLRKVTSGGAVSTPSLEVGTTSSATSSSTSTSATGATGSTTVTGFVHPVGMARDSSGNLYVADSAGHAIVKMTSAGVVSLLAGTAGVAGSQDGTGTGALFNRPAGVAVDSSGNVYVADSGNAAIRKITSGGTVTTLAGSATSAGYADGTGTAALFNNPSGVAVDASGNVFVADAYNNAIRKIDSSGTVITLAGSASTRGEADATGTAASFNCPTGVAVDTSGNVYVADAYNATIRKVTSSGRVTTLAGSAGVMGSNNASGSNALFNLPMALTVDTSGSVYIADSGNALIRKVTSGGTTTTVAGIGGIAGYRDGSGTSALFDQPRGIAADSYGALYVADTGNALVRKIDTDGTVTTITARTAAAGGSGSSGGVVDTGLSGSSSGTTTSSGGYTPSGGGGGGGGGGAMEAWFVVALALLALLRRRARR